MCPDGSRKRPATGPSGRTDPPRTPTSASDAPPPEIATLPFEQALTQLEQIVEALEEGSLSLEEALGRFERGIQLSRHLERQLNEAEARVHRLVGGEAASPLLQPIEETAETEVEETILYEAARGEESGEGNESDEAELEDRDEDEEPQKPKRSHDRLF